MRAVWSFWSKPSQMRKNSGWYSDLHHLLAWGLSLQTAGRHYPDTVLVTDRPGKRLLVDQLGLPFVHVSTELERLATIDPGWWTLGKLIAYSLQDRPFVHIDSDVFLWKPLPHRVAESPVFAQCVGYLPSDWNAGPCEIARAFDDVQIELPVEWQWARSRNESRFGLHNAGILGGTRQDFLRHYSQTAVDLVMRPGHAPAWERSVSSISPGWAAVIVEEFTLYVCLEYHRWNPTSAYRGVRIEHLFPSWDAAYDARQSARVGYTHLMGNAKSHPTIARRLEERVRREDPAYFRRCQQIADTRS